jgi:hypothetical protein
LAAAGAVSAATWSLLPISAVGALVAVGAATGIPVVKGLFDTAASAATHWATKKAISAVQAVADAGETIKTLGENAVARVGSLIGGSARPSRIWAPHNAVAAAVP